MLFPPLLAAPTASLAVTPPVGGETTEAPAPEAAPAATPGLPRRSGIVLGLSLAGALGSASGYPNNALQIGDPAYYSASGLMVGAGGTLLVLGALTDYFNFGAWFSHSVFENGDWRSRGDAGGLRVEAFPLRRLYPRLEGLGAFAQFGVGGGHLTSTRPGLPEAEGTQSFGGTGAFYEWTIGHFAIGPSVEYAAMWSRPFERHALMTGIRAVYYGGR